ncbi:NAD(P)-dependent oxidoreductase [Streptomyces sp. SDr-06]|uniref:NAD-dependent epimerase/dehydratase family protein n=1 Tax=Streptomyces sp. SDr-06 TaxID=2267702 RepID=UPI000DEA3596|nr:NAD(P)-dependent oxidoreductase [Streptomyces sp. SDr-06]RCH67781.1 NAD(P)-dependent oxidoreductase [Streptomyces sp. SDr-06]
MRVAVTGGLGRIGRAVVAELAGQGFETVQVDVAPMRGQSPGYRRADLRELWQAVDALDGVNAVVHLAATGVPDSHTLHPELAEGATYAANSTSTYNVFQAAAVHGVRRVVWASSETVLGPPFRVGGPAQLPLDESHPVRPETSYALSKATGEAIADHFAHRCAMTSVALRFSVVMDQAEYAALPAYWAEPERGRWNLWSYVDLADVAVSCRLALTADLVGATALTVAAPDTLSDRPTAELLDTYFRGVRVTRPLGDFEALQCSAKAEELLGRRPSHSWRDSAR